MYLLKNINNLLIKKGSKMENAIKNKQISNKNFICCR